MDSRQCETCGNALLTRQKRFCSRPCYGKFLKENPEYRNHFKPGAKPWNKGLVGYMAGNKHWNWKGGRRKHSGGYIEVKCENHPRTNSGGYVMEHRLVVEQHLGRLLKDDEVVHHIDGNRENNKIANLDIMTNSEHSALHAREMWSLIRQLLREHHQDDLSTN